MKSLSAPKVFWKLGGSQSGDSRINSFDVGDPKRSRQRHEKDLRDLKKTSRELPKITTFFVATGSSSSSSSSLSSVSV